MEKNVLTKESFANYRFFEADTCTPGDGTEKDRLPRNFVTYLTLFQSDLYLINDLNCYYDAGHIFKPNYTGQFSINFTRKGYFTFKTYRRLEEEYASRIMFEKPGCEFKFVQPQAGEGSCTVFSFTNEGYELIRQLFNLKNISFFADKNVFSSVIASNAVADFLHYQIISRLHQRYFDPFEIDCLVTELVSEVINLQGSGKSSVEGLLQTKHYHLRTIERAKEYLFHHFTQDVTLQELARYCFSSHFHFTRLFKQVCGYSPFYYLQQVRLKFAETLIRKSDLPVADVCFRSGFKRLDYFSSAFGKQFGASPSKYRTNCGAVTFAFR